MLPNLTSRRALAFATLGFVAFQPLALGEGPADHESGGTPTLVQRCEQMVQQYGPYVLPVIPVGPVVLPIVDRGVQHMEHLRDAIAASPLAGAAADEYPAAPACPQTEAQVRAAIRADYQARVKPIFQNKCFACHDSLQDAPWYAFGGVGGSWNPVQQDIDNGRAALDMQLDYPFMSAAKLKQPELMKKIRDAADHRSMPPGKYTFIHRSAKLTDTDVQTIDGWVDDSQAKMKCIVDAASAPKASPAAEVKKLFVDKCVDCHNKPGKKKIGDIMDLGHLGNSSYVDRAHPESSKILDAVKSGDMPEDDDKLSDQDIDKIRQWIKAGAPAQ